MSVTTDEPDLAVNGYWRLLDHPADIRMEVWGETLEDLFIHAARGLTSLLVGRLAPTPTASMQMVLEAGEVEELLVDWLREILFLYEGKDQALADVVSMSVTTNKLEAALELGEASIDEDEDVFDIKAVTYHDVSVGRFAKGFRACLVMDV